MSQMKRPRNETARAVLSYVIAYKTHHDGLSPTHREIMWAVGISSTSVVAHHIRRLVAAGRLERGPGGRGLMVPGGRWGREGLVQGATVNTPRLQRRLATALTLCAAGGFSNKPLRDLERLDRALTRLIGKMTGG